LSAVNEDAIEGSFVLEAEGFEVSNPSDENRQLEVQGTFKAKPAGQ
jgi:hypothetical protein